MLNTILEVDKLLQKSTEGVNYLNNGFDLFIRAPVLRGEYLDRCNDTYKCLERLVDDELIESFESEIRAAYLSYHDLSRMLSFLNIIDGRVSELTDSLWKFYDNKIHELENIEWLTEDDIATLDEVRGIAKYATVKNYYERPYFLICEVTRRFIDGSNMKNQWRRIDLDDIPNDEEDADLEPQSTEPGVKLQWKGDKTDLAELVWALSKSGRIADTSTGQPATQKELVNQIVNLLGLDSLDVANLMKGRFGTKGKPTTFKAQDGKTFVNTLQMLLDQRVLD